MTTATHDHSTDATKDPTPEEVAKRNAEAEQARADAAVAGTVPARKTKNKVLGSLTDVDLVDQETGTPAPLSASTPNLQATIVNAAGRAVLKVAVRGYVGEEPITILAEDADEFQDLVSALEKAATAQKKEFARKK
jgi:hypothetical protein